MQRYVSLQSIADRVGLAKSTVSLALRGSSKVNPDTRQRVKEAATSMGYHNDPLVAALATRRFKWVSKSGTVMVRLFERKISTGGYSGAVWKACGKWAQQMGYGIDDIDVTRYPNAEALERVLNSRGVRGILLFPFFDWEEIRRCKFEDQAVVMANFGNIDLPVTRVRPNAAAHVRLCYAKALTVGRKRIGLVIPTVSGNLSDIDRAALGAIEFCYEHVTGGAVRIPPFMNFSRIGAHAEELVNWIRQNQVDCVIGWNSGYLEILCRGGVRVPEEVSFISIKKESIDDGMAGLVRDPIHHAELAVDLLDREIRHNHRGLHGRPYTVLLEDDWHDGTTLTPPAVLAS